MRRRPGWSGLSGKPPFLHRDRIHCRQRVFFGKTRLNGRVPVQMREAERTVVLEPIAQLIEWEPFRIVHWRVG